MYFLVLVGMIIAVAADMYGRPASVSFMGMISGTAVMTVAPAAAAAVFMIYVGARTKSLISAVPYDSEAFTAFATRYVRIVYAMNGFIAGCYAASCFLFEWIALPERLKVNESALATGAIQIAPLVVSLLLVWIPLHYADAVMRPFSPSLRQRLAFNIRQYLLTLLVPVGAALGVYDLIRLLPKPVLDYLESPWAGALTALAIVIAGYTAAPLVLVRLWKTRSLNKGPVRERLTALCRRAKVGFRDIRVWETPGHHIINAAVMGIAGFVRYIIISRALLETMPPEELEAVFAHELGHARRRHMIYYFVFAIDFWLIANLFATAVGAPDDASGKYAVILMAAWGLVYWGLAFGFVSRAFERDGDLFAVEVMGDARPFSQALLAIAHLNGVSPRTRSWRHGSIDSRVRFLAAAEYDAEVRRRFRAKVVFLKTLIASVAALSIAATAALELLK